MTILINPETKMMVQGLGRDGSFQAIKSIEYGTNIVSCVHPNRKDQFFQEKNQLQKLTSKLQHLHIITLPQNFQILITRLKKDKSSQILC